MAIIVKSLEEVEIDGKKAGTVLDALTPDNKADLFRALSAWRDGIYTSKGEEIQALVHEKETAEADLATATAKVAEHGSIFEALASATSINEVKAALPISEEDIKARKVAELEEQLAAAKAELPTE